MTAAILGRKIGMTSIFANDGTHIPCTVIEAGPCPIVNIKRMEKDGYSAIQLGFGSIKLKKVNKPLRGYFNKSGIEPTRYLKEFRNPNKEYNVGEALTVEQFQIGDKVKVSGTSIGRGFQGVVKKHHFGGVGMTTHGQSDRSRAPGSIGSSSYPSRVFKGLKMAGRMGGKRASALNIEVFDIIPEQNIILLKGSIPGPPKSLVEIIKQ